MESAMLQAGGHQANSLASRTDNASLFRAHLELGDKIATISTAQSVCGWAGGLGVLRSILNSIRGSCDEEKISKLAARIEFEPAVFHIFTSSGPVIVSNDDGPPPFEGDFRTQLIGSSICALAHVCGGTNATDFFMDHLAPALFKTKEANEALYLQLIDNKMKILNEGVTRGLTKRFATAIHQLNIPHFTNFDYFGELNTQASDGQVLADSNYVAGFLAWLVRERKEAYFTRSSVVFQLAACFKEVGYIIGEIRAWDGTGVTPRSCGSNGVVLVTGGSIETDFLADRIGGHLDDPVYHYHMNIAGGMLSNALRSQSNLRPEVLQTIYEDTYKYIATHLRVRWIIKTSSDYERYYGSHGHSMIHSRGNRSLRVRAEWQYGPKQPSSISIRLASLYFPLSASFIAPCYERISSSEILEEIISRHGEAITTKKEAQLRNLAIYRVITASVAIAIASRLAEKGFETMRHAISIDLAGEGWLEEICPKLDGTFVEKLDLAGAVFAVAAVHAGCPSSISSSPDLKDDLVGWRNGIYSVVPSVILEMAPISEAVGLRCYEGFWGNSVVRESGAIISDSGRTLYVDNTLAHGNYGEGAAVQSLKEPYIGSPAQGPPDTKLYLSIERSVQCNDARLCFCGRINGTSIGIAGIKDVMTTLTLTFQEETHCAGHTTLISVVNAKASNWSSNKTSKPVGQWEKLHTFVPVQGDPCWAIFLAGQSSYFDGRIVYGCVECTSREMVEGSVLVGYG